MRRPALVALAHLMRHLAHHGLAALAVAAFCLVRLEGLRFGQVMVFGLPPLFAALVAGARRAPRTMRLAAWAFLGLVGLGSAVAEVPRLFPNLGAGRPGLDPSHARLLDWCAAVFLVFIAGVLPALMFGASLRAHRRGDPAQISEPTCYAGLVTFGMLWAAMPWLLALMGFWPVI